MAYQTSFTNTPIAGKVHKPLCTYAYSISVSLCVCYLALSCSSCQQSLFVVFSTKLLQQNCSKVRQLHTHTYIHMQLEEFPHIIVNSLQWRKRQLTNNNTNRQPAATLTSVNINKSDLFEFSSA